MRAGAYQFRVTGDPEVNFRRIRAGAEAAGKAGVRLLLFPECAVTGYPPRSINAESDVDFEKVSRIHDRIQELAENHQMYVVTGTMIKEKNRYCNCAMVFMPDGKRMIYRKRALWGWDRENFTEGHDAGIFSADSLKIGIRICFEVRFPEYFRELYREQTDLNLILFYDEADQENPERYDLIRGHIRTRAVENVCPVLTCNTCPPFQTAPTVLCDRSGRVLAEAEPGSERLLVYDVENSPLNFGENGRKTISDSLVYGEKRNTGLGELLK